MIKKILAIAAMMLIVGCSDDDNNDTPSDTACTVDVCKDATTLYKCVNGKKSEQKCAADETCTDNKCTPKSDNSCTVDVCKDKTTLYKCVNNQKQEVKCPQGEACADNKCIKIDNNPEDVCTEDTCKDETTLYKCIAGHKSELKCKDDEKCSVNKCVKKDDGPSTENCTESECKSPTVLNQCINNKFVEKSCEDNETCFKGKCLPIDDNTNNCKVDTCKDDSTLYKCENGKKVKVKCENNETCYKGKCTKNADLPDTGCEAPKCVSDTSYKECVDNKLTTEKQCGVGEVCQGGGCVPSFTEGTPCTNPNGYGKCTADGRQAVVCHKGKTTIYTCADPCSDGVDGIVNCPKKPTKPEVGKECKDQEAPVCFNNNNNVRLCENGHYVAWNCANSSCSVDAAGKITCDRQAPEGALTVGGTYGDPCDQKKYQEACIDDYFALICDNTNTVKIKPAGDCKVSASNPLKVEYTSAASCDPKNYMPFCINKGQAIGFCAYTDETHTETVYKAAQCPNCDSDKRAEECMHL